MTEPAQASLEAPDGADSRVTADVWDVTRAPLERRGVYVAISGNTAAGKSSLITGLGERLSQRGVDTVGVSERAFHPRYLKLMFARPDVFAFPIQLSFMLERHMVLLRNLVELGRCVVMERSHMDDVLFAEEHAGRGAIAADQLQAYLGLAAVLHARIPAPDVLVLMNPTPELSLRRLAAAEQRGEREREFPSDDAKAAWVYRWHELYERLHERYRSAARPGGDLAGTALVELDAAADADGNVERVARVIDARIDGGGGPPCSTARRQT